LDEKYAPTWALRESVQNMMAESGLIDPTKGFRNARDDAERAIELDPTVRMNPNSYTSYTRAKGTTFGRPKSAAEKTAEIRRLYRKEKLSKSEIVRRLSIGRTSVRRLLENS
jgi:hypothetical protein